MNDNRHIRTPPANRTHRQMRVDYVLVGGGLANGLIALTLAERRPEASVVLVERDGTLGGDHTWSFFDSDLPPGAAAVLAPLVVARWPGTEVRFPGHRRALESGYSTISSSRFDQVLRRRLGDRRLHAPVTRVGPGEVQLEDGRRIEAGLVVDARGPGRAVAAPGGFQKFVGLELGLRRPHSLRRRDRDGRHRPAARRLPLHLRAAARARPRARRGHGFRRRPVARRRRRRTSASAPTPKRPASTSRAWSARRSGVLPLPFAPPPATPAEPGLLIAGVRAVGSTRRPATRFPSRRGSPRGWPGMRPTAFPPPRWEAFVAAHRRQVRFACRLNRLLFRATRPRSGGGVLERFYRLPDDTIARFYALDTTVSDRLRILCGRPPRGCRCAPPPPNGVGRDALAAVQPPPAAARRARARLRRAARERPPRRALGAGPGRAPARFADPAGQAVPRPPGRTRPGRSPAVGARRRRCCRSSWRSCTPAR